MTIEIRPRNTVRGRPRTGGGFTCDRCGREAGKPRVRWPDGKICGTCFHAAVRTYGYCAACGFERMIPGRVGDSAVVSTAPALLPTSIAAVAAPRPSTTGAASAHAAHSATTSPRYFSTTPPILLP
ncbi:hypothetical protein [Rhodococcoides fascians]|uniref:hypothetical protein n=1 Tax=Rhodococcoides fascians TaxID=1828 RepID=UPI00338DA577